MASKKASLDPAQKFLGLLEQARKRGLKYLVIGGYAVVLYDVERATFDIDIGIASTPEDITTVLGLLKGLGYDRIVDPDDERDICRLGELTVEKALKMESFGARDGFAVDILFIPKEDFKFLWDYKVDVPFKGQVIPIPSLLDLIRIKEKSSRSKDLEDVKRLRHILRKGKYKKRS
jgi:hypothetical protein